MKKIYTIASLDDLAHQFWKRADQIQDRLHAAYNGHAPAIRHSDQRVLRAERDAWKEAAAILAQTQLTAVPVTDWKGLNNAFQSTAPTTEVVRAPNQTENDHANQG